MIWVQEYVTLPVMLSFVGGVLAGQLINWLQYRWRKRVHPETVVRRSFWEPVISVVVVAVLVWIMVATNQARECAIRLNVSVSTEQDIAKIERDALAAGIVASAAVPPDIQALPQNDPRRKAAYDPITKQYLGQMKLAADKREANQSVREAAQRACGR